MKTRMTLGERIEALRNAGGLVAAKRRHVNAISNGRIVVEIGGRSFTVRKGRTIQVASLAEVEVRS